MRKVIILFFILILLLIGCSSESSEIKDVQEKIDISSSCPRGQVDDRYPGMCVLYVDKNKDGFCDLG